MYMGKYAPVRNLGKHVLEYGCARVYENTGANPLIVPLA